MSVFISGIDFSTNTYVFAIVKFWVPQSQTVVTSSPRMSGSQFTWSQSTGLSCLVICWMMESCDKLQPKPKTVPEFKTRAGRQLLRTDSINYALCTTFMGSFSNCRMYHAILWTVYVFT